MKVEDLKVGDKVLAPVKTGHYTHRTFMVPVEIDRLTPKQIVIGSDRYKKDTLGKIGDSWDKLELDLTKTQENEYKAYVYKLKCFHQLPYIEGMGRVNLECPTSLLEKGVELMKQLQEVYKEAKKYCR